MRPTHLQRLALFLCVFVLMTGFVRTSPADAQSTRDAGMEAGFLSSLNAQRAASGVAPLTLNGSMSQAAAGWTEQMVNGSFLAHASDIVSGTPAGWSKVGENVGRGQSVASLTQSFMNSPGHARNVLDPEFTHVGIAVIVHPSGRVYTTHRFAALGAPAPAPTTPPAPTPAPAAPTEPTPEPPAPTPEPTPEPPVPTPEPSPEPPAPAPTVAELPVLVDTPPELLAFVDDEDAAADRRKANEKLALKWRRLIDVG